MKDRRRDKILLGLCEQNEMQAECEHHAMPKYAEVEVEFHAFLTSALCEANVCVTSQPLYFRGKKPGNYFSRADLDFLEKEGVMPCRELNSGRQNHSLVTVLPAVLSVPNAFVNTFKLKVVDCYHQVYIVCSNR